MYATLCAAVGVSLLLLLASCDRQPATPPPPVTSTTPPHLSTPAQQYGTPASATR